jgi:hypothetical protein
MAILIVLLALVLLFAAFVAVLSGSIRRDEAEDEYARKYNLPNVRGIEYDWQREFRRQWWRRKNSWNPIDPPDDSGTSEIPKVSKKWQREYGGILGLDIRTRFRQVVLVCPGQPRFDQLQADVSTINKNHANPSLFEVSL